MRALAAKSTVNQEKNEYAKALALIAKAAKRPAYRAKVVIIYPSTVNKLRGEGFTVEPLPETEQEFTVGWASSNSEASKDGEANAAGGVGAHVTSKRKVASKRVRTNQSK